LLHGLEVVDARGKRGHDDSNKFHRILSDHAHPADSFRSPPAAAEEFCRFFSALIDAALDNHGEIFNPPQAAFTSDSRHSAIDAKGQLRPTHRKKKTAT